MQTCSIMWKARKKRIVFNLIVQNPKNSLSLSRTYIFYYLYVLLEISDQK